MGSKAYTIWTFLNSDIILILNPGFLLRQSTNRTSSCLSLDDILSPSATFGVSILII